jgi:protein-disulfide isomerase
MSNGIDKNRLRTVLDIVASAAAIATALLLVWINFARPALAERARNPLPKAPLVLDPLSPVLGSTNAPVVAIAFSDFQCPYCAKFALEVLPRLKTRFIDTGNVRLVFQHLPLSSIHPQAELAARAGVCAARLGVGKEGVMIGPELPKALARPDLLNVAAAQGLDQATFSKCLDAAGDEVAESMKEAGRLQVESTPTLLIGTSRPDGTVKIAYRLPATNESAVVQALEKLLK